MILPTSALNSTTLLSFLLQVVISLGVITVVSFRSFLRKLILGSTLRNIPGPARPSILKGNLGQLFDQQGWAFHREIVRQFGGVVKIHGLCGDEQLYISDPKALRHIVIEDQDIYEETEFFIKTNLVCFGPGIVSVVGERHRKQRKLISPVFNIHHLRNLTPIFYRVSHELVDVLKRRFDGHAPGTQLEIEMFYWMKRIALEVIGQGGLGCSFGPLDNISMNEYSDSVKNFAPTLFRLSILRQFLPFFSSLGPAWLRRAVVRVLPIKRVQRLREIVDVMDRTVRAVYEDKCASTRMHGRDLGPQAYEGEEKDIMSILLRENMKSTDEDRLTDEEILGQMSTFVFAGQDTTSAGLARILQTLAKHPEAQIRLRNELIEAQSLAGTDLDYDTLHELPFLDAVCRETLRLYPPIFMLHRTTTKDTILPLSTPLSLSSSPVIGHGHGYPPQTISAIPIQRNTNVIIAIEAANRRTDIWGPDADKWRPERWLGQYQYKADDGERNPDPKSDSDAEDVRDRLPGVYSGLMTFLGGGRSCIGFNFALLEIKTTLSTLLPAFHLSLPSNKELAWKLGGIVSPGVKDDPIPKLPLRLSLVGGRGR